MTNTIQIKRGANADLPVLNAGEFGFSTDSHQLYIGDGTTNHEVVMTDFNLFEEISNVIREKSGGGYDNDFVIGSPQLDDDGSHDARMFFDKSKGAFRAGGVGGEQWNDGNIGYYSHAEGNNTIASGDYSHAEGRYSVANGNQSHAEGSSSTSSGGGSHAEGVYTIASRYYSHAEGYYSDAYLESQHAHASGRFSVNGDAQSSSVVVRKETTDATQTELTIDGGAPDADSRLILPASRTWAFHIMIAAREPSTVDSGIYEIKGGIKRDGSNNTTLIGAITNTTIAEDQAAWAVTAVADDTNECLVVKVTGEASKTIHWVADISLAEVG